MTKQQLKQARKILNLSCKRFGQELGVGDRWIRRLESNVEEYQPSEKLSKKVEILLKANNIKQQMLKEIGE